MKTISYHVGEKIKEVLVIRGIKQADLARMISTTPQNVYQLFTRKSIDSEQLFQISDVLSYNFFESYCESLGFQKSFNEFKPKTSLFIQEPEEMYNYGKMPSGPCQQCELRERLLKAKDELIESLKSRID
jgi:transcriptional regulator with XRE-family HTH domain